MTKLRLIQTLCRNFAIISASSLKERLDPFPSLHHLIVLILLLHVILDKLIVDGRMFLSGDGIDDNASNYSGSTDSPAKLVNVTEYITKTMYYM